MKKAIKKARSAKTVKAVRVTKSKATKNQFSNVYFLIALLVISISGLILVFNAKIFTAVNDQVLQEELK